MVNNTISPSPAAIFLYSSNDFPVILVPPSASIVYPGTAVKLAPPDMNLSGHCLLSPATAFDTVPNVLTSFLSIGIVDYH